MSKQRGSITVPCILAALVLLALATALLIFTTREYEHTREYIRSRQLRLLVSSAMLQADTAAAGENILLEHCLYPDKEKVVLTLIKTKSGDGLIRKAEAAAESKKYAGAVQRFKQFRLELTAEQKALAGEYAMIGKQFTGLEKLGAEARYIQAQEVSLPQVSFMQELGSAPTAKEITNDGLSAAFYYINGSFTFPTGGKTIAGSTVFATSGNMIINASTRFSGRLALISQKGTIRISKNCRFANALLMAQSGVEIDEGCEFTGCIIAPRIVINGAGRFNPSQDIAEPFISAITVAVKS